MEHPPTKIFYQKIRIDANGIFNITTTKKFPAMGGGTTQWWGWLTFSRLSVTPLSYKINYRTEQHGKKETHTAPDNEQMPKRMRKFHLAPQIKYHTD